MRNSMLFFLFFLTGSLYAQQLNVGDTVTVPLSVYAINFTKDLPSTVPAKVVYVDQNMYILIVDTMDYTQAGLALYETVSPSVFNSYRDSVSKYLNQVINDVNSFFNISLADIYDSDNDPRLFVVILPFYVSANVFPNNKNLYGSFEPYYSLESSFDNHEYIYINCLSNITVSGSCDSEFKSDVLRKYLYFLYTSLVLWTEAYNEHVITGEPINYKDLLFKSLYYATKIDNSDNWFGSFSGSIDGVITEGINPYYGSQSASYIYTKDILALDEENADKYILWLYYLESKVGEQDLMNLLNTVDFENAVKLYFESRGTRFVDVVNEFVLKTFLTNKGYGYDFQHPMISGNDVYDLFYPDANANKNSITITPSDDVPTAYDRLILPYASIGVRVIAPTLSNQYAVVNLKDNINYSVFEIDTFSKTVTQVYVDTPIEVFKFQIQPGSKYYLFVNNSENALASLYYSYGDTSPPAIQNFFVFPDRYIPNRFEVYLITDEYVCIDGGICYGFVSLETPLGTQAEIKVDLLDEYQTNKVYSGVVQVIPMMEGRYYFRIGGTYGDVSDEMDNKLANVYEIPVDVVRLNAYSYYEYENGFIKIYNTTSSPYMLFLNRFANNINIYSDRDGTVRIHVKAKPNEGLFVKQGINFIPVDYTYSNGYIVADIELNKTYIIMSSSFSGSFAYWINGRTLKLILPSNSSVEISLYRLNGSLYKSYKLNLKKGLNEVKLTDVSKGIYVLKIKYGSSLYKKAVIIY